MAEQLFNKETFENISSLEIEKIFSEISKAGNVIASLSNPEVYKNGIVNKYKQSIINVDFNEIVVTPFIKTNTNNEVWIEYVVPFTGNGNLLLLNSMSRRMPKVEIDATISNSDFSYEIFTGYHNSITLTDDIKRQMNQRLIGIKEYVEKEIELLNAKVNEYNESLSKIVSDNFDVCKAKIDERNKTSDDLNPFKKKQ